MFGVQWVMLRRVVEILVGWRNRFGEHGSSFALNMVPVCLMWAIW